jgi:hypothetical protein
MVKAEQTQDTVLLTIRNGKARYGIPESSLYEMRLKGVPGFVTIGRSVRIHRPTFEKWLEEQAQVGIRDNRGA